MKELPPGDAKDLMVSEPNKLKGTQEILKLPIELIKISVIAAGVVAAIVVVAPVLVLRHIYRELSGKNKKIRNKMLEILTKHPEGLTSAEYSTKVIDVLGTDSSVYTDIKSLERRGLINRVWVEIPEEERVNGRTGTFHSTINDRGIAQLREGGLSLTPLKTEDGAVSTTDSGGLNTPAEDLEGETKKD